MGSSKKHKRDKDATASSSSARKHKHKDKLRAPSPPDLRDELLSNNRGREQRVEREQRDREQRERERERERRHKKNKEKEQQQQQQRTSVPSKSSSSRRSPPAARSDGRGGRDEYHSDSSDVVEVPMAPPAPKISARSRSASPIPENGAGDCLSVAETNKLRAKLGLKPLEMGTGGSSAPAAAASDAPKTNADGHSMHKDEWGEFYHKPADNIAQKLQAEKLREKFRQKKEKRLLEDKLKKVKKLGESDDFDDINAWLERSRNKEKSKADAAKRAAALEEMDADFDADEDGFGNRAAAAAAKAKKRTYTDRHLKGLKVAHELDSFGEGKTVILTLKDHAVLDEDEDTLINVNMQDDERYKKNVVNRKANPNHYGYDVYEEQFDHFGNPIERNILSKYDEDLDDADENRKKTFTIGESLEDERDRQRRLLEIKTKLAGKRLESLDEPLIHLARDTYTEDEMAK